MALISDSHFLSKKNRNILIKCLTEKDAEIVHQAIVEINLTSPYVLTTPQRWIELGSRAQLDMIEKSNTSRTDIFFVAVCDDRIIGIANFVANRPDKTKHRGALGISLHHEFRGEGIGKAMMNIIINHCRSLARLEMLELNVMSKNSEAIALYYNLGFKKISEYPNAYILDDGTRDTDIFMSLDLR